MFRVAYQALMVTHLFSQKVLNAGAWGIGLAISGNEVGVQLDEWNSFSEEVKQKHRDRIYPTMYQRGAHYVVDSIADLMPCIDDIELRLKRGDKP